jgi:hypothetical protein
MRSRSVQRLIADTPTRFAKERNVRIPTIGNSGRPGVLPMPSYPRGSPRTWFQKIRIDAGACSSWPRKFPIATTWADAQFF